MGNVRFGVDSQLARHAAGLGIQVAYETGTYLGDSAALLAQAFKKVHTIELRPDLAARARRRFTDIAAITVHEGHSPEVLSALLAESSVPAFFWLDAHWFPKQDPKPFATQCSLIDELLTLDEFICRDMSLIAIDDLSLFVEPPAGELYIGEQWPSTDDIHQITKQWPHRVVAYDDMLVLLPRSIHL